MRLTPLDIRKQEFRKGMRGLDADEVYAFLSTVADEYEAVINDNKALRERLLELDDKVQEYRNMEKTLRDTLLTAERVTVEAKENARRESDLIVKEAQIEAQKAVRDIRTTAMKLRQEIQELRQQRDSYLSRMKILVDSHMRFVEAAEKEFAEEERELADHQRETSQNQPKPGDKPAVAAPAQTETTAEKDMDPELITAIEPQPSKVSEILDRVIEQQKNEPTPPTDAAVAKPPAGKQKSGDSATGNAPIGTHQPGDPVTGTVSTNAQPTEVPSTTAPTAAADERHTDSAAKPNQSVDAGPAYRHETAAAAAQPAVQPTQERKESISAAAPGASDVPGEWSLEKLKRDILGGSKPDHEND
ncbi:MAG: DivIVA domain-containing protein [Candidatus Latescibacterota bacterium]|nr:MAG: DivIVA domain-containing protein [Candidatus Latescibacterota bacterium]